MEKEKSRRLMCHVLMDGNDVDGFVAQRLEHRLQLVFEHGEVASDDCIAVRSREGGPGVQPHLLCHRATTGHLRFAPNDELRHPVLHLRLLAQRSLRWAWTDSVCLRRRYR